MNSFWKLSTLILISALSFSCTEKNGENNIPIHKGAGGGGGGGGSGLVEKADKKTLQDALTAEVLVQLDKASVLKSANATAVIFMANLKINNRIPIQWPIALKLKTGEQSAVVNLDDAYGLSDYKLGLAMTGQRFEKSDKNKKKDDLGYLVLSFQLGKVTDDSTDETKKSLELVLVDLNHVKSSKA
jgi:hypothetical protein